MKSKILEIEKFDLFPYEKTLGDKTNIPDKSGIYAWYIDFSKFKNFSTVEDFIRNLELINSLISTDRLNGAVKSFFRRYSIDINEERTFLDKYYIEETDGEVIVGKKLQDLTLEDCTNLMNLLSNFSILVNPLYVGISSSFRTRWSQHQKAFYAIKKMQENHEDEKVILEESQKSFGGRVAKKGFNWEYLIFACVEKDIDRRIISNAEFLINRFYNPLFGRR